MVETKGHAVWCALLRVDVHIYLFQASDGSLRDKSKTTYH
jgi:hypothetical protein